MEIRPEELAFERGYVPTEDGAVLGLRGAPLSLFASNDFGYLAFSFMYEGKHKTCQVARLVALLKWTPEEVADKYVTHLNGDVTDNCIENLALIENRKFSWKIQRKHRWKRQRNNDFGNSVLSPGEVWAIFIASENIYGHELAARYQISQSAVSRIRNGLTYHLEDEEYWNWLLFEDA